MIPTDKIATLPPIIVTGVFLATVALSSLAQQQLQFAWPWSWLALNLAGMGSVGFIALWTWSLASLVLSRTEPEHRERATTVAHLRSAFIYGAICIVGFSMAPFASPPIIWPIFAAAALANLAFGYNWLRALWRVSKRFPGSENTFTTFVQMLYFPLGVWFLYPRLKQLRAAPLFCPVEPT